LFLWSVCLSFNMPVVLLAACLFVCVSVRLTVSDVAL